MGYRFSVLGSGSAGNAAWLEANGFGILVDAGLGPRVLGARLAAIGSSWKQVRAVILTHTHTDHWNARTLEQLHRLQIPFYCHPEHHGSLRGSSQVFDNLLSAGLVRAYERSTLLRFGPALVCAPFALQHDSVPTFGFRFSGEDSMGRPWAIGYAADLGTWTPDLVEALSDLDVLALEFNHDEDMEWGSRRPIDLIQRVIGDQGHLSNRQAASFLQAIIAGSRARRLRDVVLLHLSRECNRPALARAVATRAVAGTEIVVHVAAQDSPSRVLAGPALEGEPPTLAPPHLMWRSESMPRTDGQ